MIKKTSILLLLCLVGPLAVAQQSFDETMGIVLVEVPVQVLRDGEPVNDLEAEDFEVTWGRKKQDLVSFEKIDLTVPMEQAQVQEMRSSARRHFLILFDLTFSDPGAILRSREAAEKLVAEALHPSDLVGVASWSELRGPQLILGFTSDRDQVALAIHSLGAPEMFKQNQDPLGLVLGDTSDIFAGLATTGGVGGEMGQQAAHDNMVRNHVLELRGSQQKANRERQTQQFAAMAASFAQLGQMLATIEGRKHVILLSEGFDSAVLRGTEDREAIQGITRAAESGETWRIDSDERFGSTGTMNNLSTMVLELQRADCAIQAVDISGLREGGGRSSQGQDSLFAMAADTGGSLIPATNDLGEAMESVLQRTSVTYLLAVQPQGLKWDGKYHKLKVQLANKDRGTEVLYRPGFFAPKPQTEKSAQELRLEAASQIMGGQTGGSLVTSLLALPLPGRDGSSYMPVLLEVDGGSLLEAFGSNNAAVVEIFLYAIDSSGHVADFKAEQIRLKVDEARPTLEKSGLKFFAGMELPPADYSLRALVRDSRSGQSGTLVSSVVVPAFGGAPSVLLPPLFPEEPGKWILAREKAGGTEYPFPFYMGQQPFLPAAEPVAPRGGSLPLVLFVVGLGDGPAKVKGQLFDIDGNLVADLTVKIEETTGVPEWPDVRCLRTQIKLPKENGAFLLRMAVESAGDEISSTIPLTLTKG